MRVLIVDDEAPARAKVRRYLQEHDDVEIAAAIIDTLGGRVLWFGVVGGGTGDQADPALAASAAQALARTLFP